MLSTTFSVCCFRRTARWPPFGADCCFSRTSPSIRVIRGPARASAKPRPRYGGPAKCAMPVARFSVSARRSAAARNPDLSMPLRNRAARPRRRTAVLKRSGMKAPTRPISARPAATIHLIGRQRHAGGGDKGNDASPGGWLGQAGVDVGQGRVHGFLRITVFEWM